MPRLWAQWLYAFHRPKRSLARRLHVLRMHRCAALARHARGEARALLRQIAKLYGTQACESASDMQDLEWEPEPAGSKHGSWALGGFWQALPPSPRHSWPQQQRTVSTPRALSARKRRSRCRLRFAKGR